MANSGKLTKAVSELDAYLAEAGGCGDGSCIIVKPKGQHTNGGCRCSADRYKMQRFAYAHNRFATAARAAQAAAEGEPT